MIEPMEKAKHLRVLVKKDDIPSVDIEMPVYSLNILDTIIPESVHQVLQTKNIQLKKIIENVKQTDSLSFLFSLPQPAFVLR